MTSRTGVKSLATSLSLSVLLFSLTVTGNNQTCALYDPQTPGIHCFHGKQVLEAITESKRAWMVELYSSWCGHCQKFAPRLKELAAELEVWSDVFKVAVYECTGSKENQDVCSQFGIEGYPTIRFFQPLDPKPLNFKNVIVGAGKSNDDLRHLIVDHIVSVTPYPTDWPIFDPLIGGEVLQEKAAGWKPSVFVFEEEQSYLGKELVLDFVSVLSLRIRRVSNLNTALVRHYSILEFPSAVIELKKDHFDVLPGKSVKAAVKSKVIGYLQSMGSDISPSLLDRKQVPSPPNTLENSHQNRPHPPSNNVELHDLLSAMAYALRAEVPLHVIISGSAYSTLFNFVSLLEQAFSGVSPEGVSTSLKAVRLKLEARKQTGFITNKEWHRIMDSKLDSDLFPSHVTWKACNGSLPHLRGYPCGLWVLMHTLTILTLPVNHTQYSSPQPRPPGQDHAPPIITSTRALAIMASFVKKFFSCEVCRQHFTKMSRTLPQHSLGDNGDAILWLWEAHNSVNARLSMEGGEDPLPPKHLFPSISRCPYCYQRTNAFLSYDQDMLPNFNNTKFVRGESLLVVGVAEREEHAVASRQVSRSMLHARQLRTVDESYLWNRTAVLLYLWNFYHLEQYGNRIETGMEQRHVHHRISQTDILQAAWPHRFGPGSEHYYRHYRMSGGLDSDMLCLTWYITCVVFVALMAFWLHRKRTCRKVYHYY